MSSIEQAAIMLPITKLTRDTRAASVTLGIAEVRFLVDAYYQIQEYRKAAENQVRSLAGEKEPHEVLAWYSFQAATLEKQLQSALDRWSSNNPLAAWAKSITGIGPVISSGLAAHIDISKAPTAGHIWRYAGLDPTQEWLGTEKATAVVKSILQEVDSVEEAISAVAVRQRLRPENLRRMASQDRDGQPITPTQKSLIAALAKRPWNASLKVLCWKIGESFVKVSGNPSDVYGKIYLDRKAIEWQKNEAGEYAEQAKAKLDRFNIGKTTDAYAAYSKGKLPQAHLHARAKRYAVKLFLAHYQHVGWTMDTGTKPPKPWVIEHGGHVHFIPPPNFNDAEWLK